jgi:threonylcarbamoyladenosine tRNA methylthiotransferase MtaB
VTPSFHVEHFGCRAARADGEAVSHRLRAAGLGERQPSSADVVVVNTCSVTAEADRAALAFIRRTHRLNPAAKIVVTGCFAQRAPEELATLEGVCAVVGNSHKGLAPEIILRLARESGILAFHPSNEASLAPVDSAALMHGPKPVPFTGAGISRGAPAPIWADEQFLHSFLEVAQVAPGAQTRPNLKIQEGCANRCTFCVIPSTRGPSKSLPYAVVLRQVEGFVAAGGNELVLSGINLGRWGRDFSASAQQWTAGGAPSPNPAPRTLAGLLREIFARTTLPLLRLSSIEPMDWDAELIGLMAEFGGMRLARHAHLPLQSGSDAVLRRMHRRYRPWHYTEKVAALVRAAGPELTLGADVMVGFPGETDAEFEETVALVRALPFGYLHLFPFSARPGTPGWALHAERPVPAGAVEERMKALRALAAEKSQTHRRCFVGRELEAITLRTPPELSTRGRSAALTENFLPVEFEGRWEANRLVRLRVSGLMDGGTLEALVGEDYHAPDWGAAIQGVLGK